MASIFVQIASYHDFELAKTVYDCVNKSSGKHQICFGIHNNFREDNQIFLPLVPNTKIKESKAPENIGVGISRSIANKLYDGQDYYLQVDSHTRFYPHWDDELVRNIKQAESDKPLISAYPASYTYDSNLQERCEFDRSVTEVCFQENTGQFEQSLIPHQRAVAHKGTGKNKSISAGFIFSTGAYAELGFNEKIMFWGEEILTAARAFTNGFDLLLPDKQYIYHLYYDHSAPFQKNWRRHIWQDFPEEYQKIDAESKKLVFEIFDKEIIGPKELGSVRTLSEYGQYAGLDFKARKVL
jgi:hypothetical protein